MQKKCEMQERLEKNSAIILILISLIFLLAVGFISRGQSCPQPVNFNTWIDPDREGSKAEALTVSNVDDTVISINIPFTFNYQDTDYQQLFAGSNGTLAFEKSKRKKKSITTIGGYLGNLQLEYACPPSSWTYEIIGRAPERCIAVTWKGFIRVNGTCGEYVSYQVKLFENTNLIASLAFENMVPSTAITLGPGINNELSSASEEKEHIRIEENIWTLY